MNKRPLKVRLRDDDVLFYLHLPKTAGSSLISILDAQFEPEEIFPVHHFSALPEVFEKYSPERLARFRLVRGHLFFGPHDNGIYNHLTQNPIRITLLRNPVERTISAYRHIVRKAENRLHKEIVSNNLSLKEFVCHPSYYDRVANRQTRNIVGALNGNPKPRLYGDLNVLSDEALLELAKERLEQFAFVGLTERFQESVQLLSYIFDWRQVSEIPTLNTAPTPTSRDSIPPDALAAIMEQTQLDAELYRYAEQLFEAKWAQMQAELNSHPN